MFDSPETRHQRRHLLPNPATFPQGQLCPLPSPTGTPVRMTAKDGERYGPLGTKTATAAEYGSSGQNRPHGHLPRPCHN